MSRRLMLLVTLGMWLGVPALHFDSTVLQAAKVKDVKPLEVTAMTPDSMEIVAYLYQPDPLKYQRPPLAILLHERTASHAAWESFAQELCQDGIAAYAVDLRGYGYSIYDYRTNMNRPPNTFRQGDVLKYPADLRLLLSRLFAEQGRMLDTIRFAVVGADVGANAGLIFAEKEPRVKYVAMISPGLDFDGLKIADVVAGYKDRPLYIAAGTQDIASNETCQKLQEVAKRELDIALFETYLRGNELFNKTAEIRTRVRGDLLRFRDGK